MKKERISIIPHWDKVLIKVSKQDWNSQFSKYITVKGKKVELFIDTPEEEGYEKRFQQNVSVGAVLAVGEKVKGLLKGDIAIIDYTVTGNDDSLIGFVNGDKVVSIPAYSTYHDEDSIPQMNGRHSYVAGDFDYLAKILGVIRGGKLIAFSPYVFLKHEDANKLKVSKGGVMYEEVDQICQREVLASGEDSVCKEGAIVLLKESDLFPRTIDGKEISVVFESDIIGVI
jgi:hypothetical protein